MIEPRILPPDYLSYQPPFTLSGTDGGLWRRAAEVEWLAGLGGGLVECGACPVRVLPEGMRLESASDLWATPTAATQTFDRLLFLAIAGALLALVAIAAGLHIVGGLPHGAGNRPDDHIGFAAASEPDAAGGGVAPYALLSPAPAPWAESLTPEECGA